MKGKCCFNCRWSKGWSLTPTGRAVKDAVAICIYEPDYAEILKMIPASICKPELHRCKVRADRGSDCPVFEEKTK